MDAQMNAAERILADREDAAKKEFEEPLMRAITRGPNGLSVVEVLKLVQRPELAEEAARFVRSRLRGGKIVVLKKGAS